MFCRPPPSQPIGGVRVLPSHLPPFKTQPWRRFSTHLLPSSTHLPTHLLLFSTHLPTMEQPRPHLPALNFELVNERVGDYFRNEREDVANWQSKSEIHSQEEILGTDKPHSLVPNIPDASWPSSEEYLQAHYNLLREDAVTPLRDAVAMVQDNPLQADEKGVAVYENVYLTGLNVTDQGLAIRVCFSARRAGKNIFWATSDRLRPGTLVALSPVADDFMTKCVVGVVACKLLKKIEKDPKEVVILLASFDDVDLDTQKEWTMVEARTGYFEATRNTMTALQKLSTEKFPLKEIICGVERNIGAPEYLKSQPCMDLSPLVQAAPDQKPTMDMSVDILNNWPIHPMGQLDAPQWAALRQMLTKSLSVTQGPPGTGKTFTVMSALRILLANKRPGDPPILVTAPTNHALDQLLMQISEFEPNFVKLGSGSAHPKICTRTIQGMRQKDLAPFMINGSMQAAVKGHQMVAERITSIIKPLTEKSLMPISPIDVDTFRHYGLLNEHQVLSLSKCIGSNRRNSDPLAVWLGNSVERFIHPSSGDEQWMMREMVDDLQQEIMIQENEFTGWTGFDISLAPDFTRHKKGQRSPAADIVKLYLENDDLRLIPSAHRGTVYNYLRKQLISILHRELLQVRAPYQALCESFVLSGVEQDYPILRDANVVGITTIGLNKYRGLLASVKPRVIIVDEAARVLEGSITTACLPSLQQMILIGDYVQMKAHCSVPYMARYPWNLHISMFERFARNGIALSSLEVQRRMIPDIRGLVTPLYDDALRDHPSVLNRSFIPGMGDIRTYWFTHNRSEEHNEMASRENAFEARMLIQFFWHLVQNGVSPDDITILTFYEGQCNTLKNIMYSAPFIHLAKVLTVDAYQGEENRIILLSLVRSNLFDGTGFVSLVNRACLALSRAKDGLFIFGDAECVTKENALWKEVAATLARSNPPRIGSELPLFCDAHQTRTIITSKLTKSSQKTLEA
ncbi:unnamed protein product [Penicillium olsonii]|uniref:Uncharacterized protein n=1 Tax=Penicillium olsonii TaxID=99116 RepID=A0A9W4N5R8_PENOL|nr:unnamed protein product [Penicillium olsonii]CAG8263212.1 unnamed protein product [Penicillium olsonii]